MFPKQTKSTATGWAGEVAAMLAMGRCAGVSKGERSGQAMAEER